MATFSMFSIFCALFLLQIASKTDAAPSSTGGKTGSTSTGVRENILKNGRCPKQLCFALDGSRFLNATEFIIVKKLARRISSIVSVKRSTEFSAVQYGLSNTVISMLTFNVSAFIHGINATTYEGAEEAFLGSGVAFCIRATSDAELRGSDAIITIGSAKSTFATSFLPTVIAAAKPAKLYSIGVGASRDTGNLLKLAGGAPSNVYGIEYRNGTFGAPMISKLARAISLKLCRLE